MVIESEYRCKMCGQILITSKSPGKCSNCGQKDFELVAEDANNKEDPLEAIDSKIQSQKAHLHYCKNMKETMLRCREKLLIMPFDNDATEEGKEIRNKLLDYYDRQTPHYAEELEKANGKINALASEREQLENEMKNGGEKNGNSEEIREN